MSISKSVLLAASIAVSGSVSAQAAPVIYELNVEAELRDITFGPIFAVDNSTGTYQRYNSMVFNDADTPAFDGFRWIEDARSTRGSLEMVYDELNPSAGAVFSNCTGVLRSMCSGAAFRVDLDVGNLTSTDSNSFLSQLTANSLRYSDDRRYSWEDGSLHYTTLGYGVTVNHDISSLSIAPVPLSASFGFLLAGLGMLMGHRLVSRRRA